VSTTFEEHGAQRNEHADDFLKNRRKHRKLAATYQQAAKEILRNGLKYTRTRKKLAATGTRREGGYI
jgi:hypothetical protein